MRRTRETYEAIADEYVSRHVDRTGIMDQFDRFCELLDEQSSRNETRSTMVLDVGCGPGWETAALARRGYRTLGVDVSLAFLRHAESTVSNASAQGAETDTGVAAMDMRHLGIPANVLAGIWACASVHHVPRDDAPRVLDEFARSLTPGGVLAVSVKRGEGTTTGDAYPEDSRRFTRYQPPTLSRLLTNAGFDVEHVDASEDWVWAWARLPE